MRLKKYTDAADGLANVSGYRCQRCKLTSLPVSVNAVFSELFTESAAVKAHDFGGSGLISGNIAHHSHEEGFLDFLNDLLIDVRGLVFSGVIVQKLNDVGGDVVTVRIYGVFAV